MHIISNFNKDENARHVQGKMLSMPYTDQADAIRTQIESKFYNVSDGLEPHIVAVLNTKLSQIRDHFIH